MFHPPAFQPEFTPFLFQFTAIDNAASGGQADGVLLPPKPADSDHHLHTAAPLDSERSPKRAGHAELLSPGVQGGEVLEQNAFDLLEAARLGEGDLCLILIDQVEEALAYITEKVKAAA